MVLVTYLQRQHSFKSHERYYTQIHLTDDTPIFKKLFLSPEVYKAEVERQIDQINKEGKLRIHVLLK